MVYNTVLFYVRHIVKSVRRASKPYQCDSHRLNWFISREREKKKEQCKTTIAFDNGVVKTGRAE